MISKSKIPAFYCFIIFLLMCFSLNSCLEQPKVKLLKSDEDYIDSIFSNSIEGLRSQVDSLCEEEREKLFPLLVDSIVAKRLEEIDFIIKK